MSTIAEEIARVKDQPKHCQASPEDEMYKLMRSYNHLVELVDARNGPEAEAHWRRHMQNASTALLRGYEKTKVRDIMV